MNAPFIINPNMRLNTDTFVLVWQPVPEVILTKESMMIPETDKYVLKKTCLCFYTQIDKFFTIYYAPTISFEQQRTQSWLRKAIKEAIIFRANQVLPVELKNTEPHVGLYSKSVSIKKLRKAYGCCHYLTRHITFHPMLVLLPWEFREEVIIHELCHIQVHGHSKKFWNLLSKKLGRDSKLSKLTHDIFYTKYHAQLTWLMK